MNDDEILENYTIPRYLSAPVYRWRAAGLMLTDEDAFAVLVISMMVWFAISSLGLGSWGYGPLTLDPFGFFVCGLALAYGITGFHLLRPDDSITHFLKGTHTAGSLAAWLPRGDQTWTPSPRRKEK